MASGSNTAAAVAAGLSAVDAASFMPLLLVNGARGAGLLPSVGLPYPRHRPAGCFSRRNEATEHRNGGYRRHTRRNGQNLQPSDADTTVAS